MSTQNSISKQSAATIIVNAILDSQRRAENVIREWQKKAAADPFSAVYYGTENLVTATENYNITTRMLERIWVNLGQYGEPSTYSNFVKRDEEEQAEITLDCIILALEQWITYITDALLRNIYYSRSTNAMINAVEAVRGEAASSFLRHELEGLLSLAMNA